MAVTLAEAIKRIQQTLLAGVGEAVLTADQFTSAISVELTDALRIDWNEENSLGSGAQVIEAGGAISESAATTNLSAVYLERFIDEVLIPNSVSEKDRPFQIMQKAKGLGRKLADQIINGAASHTDPVSINSLETYITAGQTTAVNGALTFAALDSICMDVLAGEGQLVLVMNKKLMTKFYTLMRAVGGVPMTEIAGGLLQVPSFNGVPVLRNDFIANDEGSSTGSSVYAVSLDPAYTKLYWRANSVGANPYDSMFEYFAPFQTAGYDSQTHRIGFNTNLVIRSPLALARASNVTTA